MRYHYLDFARGTLMSAGIVIHASQVFGPTPWRVSNPDSSEYFQYVIDGIHWFRMHSFYLIAGFFAAMLLMRYPVREYLKMRMFRLGIPIVFTGLTINSLSHLISHQNYQHGLSAFDATYWLGGGWVGQLWFVINLMIYLVLIGLVVAAFPSLLHRIRQWPLKLWHLFVLLAVSVLLLKRVAWRLPEPMLGDKWLFISVTDLFVYLPYFVLGMVFYLKRELFERWMSRPMASLSLMAGILVLRKVFAGVVGIDFVWELLDVMAVLWFMAALFWFCRKYFNADNGVVRTISDSSYTLYLVHSPILLGFASVLVSLELNLVLKFILLVVATWLASFAIHQYVVERFGVMKLLLNGKRS